VLVVIVRDCLILDLMIGLYDQLGLILGLRVLELLDVLVELSCLLLHPH
jgi:hypothetical protein